ncbi:MAG TPA: AbrB/MazE/SpoVT family DNA-binding domain-containing protein [Candidatus Acetothermia bacterium]|nr:AbrB/MazE/SpoVT family DNA-binding domain-containing protein [Candidatus Acetothermia bacterium]
MPLVKITRSRQVSIPEDLCEEMGLREGDYVEISRRGDQLVLRPMAVVDRAQAELAQLLEPVWERNKGADPAAVEADVEKAVGEVRTGRR